MISEGIPEERSVYENINKLKEYQVIDYEMTNMLHQARDVRNKGIHDNPDKQAYRLCALLFRISVWFYDKYSGDSSFRKPSFDRSLVVEKDKQTNKSSSNSSSSGFDKEGMRGLLEDVIDEKMKDLLSNIGNSSQKSSGSVENSTPEETTEGTQTPEETDHETNGDSEEYQFSKTNGSYLLTELSKLKKSSKESIEDSQGFKNKFKKYMHVEREIQHELKNKLEKLSKKDSSQIIMLAGSVGDGKSHLLSYMNYKYPELMQNFDVHNDATESFDPNLTAIETLIKVLEPFSDENIDSSNKKLILAINLGILSNLMDDNVIKSKFSKLYSILNDIDIFDNSTVTNNMTKDFLTIINFTDYQLYELYEEGVNSKFISELINNVVEASNKNPFYLAYKKDDSVNFKSPIIYNYQMLMDDDVKEVVVQYLLKSIIKNKKIISTRELLNFIYEIIVPANIVKYSDMKDVSKFIDDLLPNLLFNTTNRSDILKEIALNSPINVRSEEIDKFIISLNTLNIKTVLSDYFDDDYEEFKFFKEFLLSNEYANDKSKQKIIKDSLLYYVLFFGNDEIKKEFIDESYIDYLKYLYYFNYKPMKLRTLFKQIKKSILAWKGSIKKDYIIIDETSHFIISKRVVIDFKHMLPSENDFTNTFKNYISFNIYVNEDSCSNDFCIGESCNEHKCIILDVDYLLFDAINKINQGYKPNKNEKENLVVFDEFIDDVLSRKGDNELLISYKSNDKSFKFKSLSGNYYSLEGD